MRIDLPQCGFKNCRKCFDGNCKSVEEYRCCEYAIKVSRLRAYEERNWIDDRFPEVAGEYEVKIFDVWTTNTFESSAYWNGTEFELGNDNNVVAWKLDK